MPDDLVDWGTYDTIADEAERAKSSFDDVKPAATLKAKVIGQDKVADRISKQLKRRVAQVKGGGGKMEKPLGVFCLAGPPGTGKSYFSKVPAVPARAGSDPEWPQARIEALLEEAAESRTFPDRFRVLVRPFIEAETPYIRPAAVPSREPGTVALRLSAFSCSSFAHFLAALAHSWNYNEFVQNVCRMRYRRKVRPGDFICDLDELMKRMIALDVVTSLAPMFAGRLGNAGRVKRWLDVNDARKIEPFLQCGDLLFFRSAEAATEGAKAVTHTGFVYKHDDALPGAFLVHCGATERGPVSRRRGCVAIARRSENFDPAAPPAESCLPLPEYLETRRRHFSHVTALRFVRYSGGMT